jgi:hypothetical protein
MSEGCLSVRAMSLELTFCDVDYARGSRAHGRGAPISPPEGSVTGHRSLYGHARRLRILVSEWSATGAD